MTYKQVEELTSQLNKWLYEQTESVKWPNGLQEGEVQQNFAIQLTNEKAITTMYGSLPAAHIKFCGWNSLCK